MVMAVLIMVYRGGLLSKLVLRHRPSTPFTDWPSLLELVSRGEIRLCTADRAHYAPEVIRNAMRRLNLKEPNMWTTDESIVRLDNLRDYV